jgi:hypothetical protein
MNSPSENIPRSKQDVAQALLQSLDPLMEKITPIIRSILAEYIISLRRQLLSGDHFLSVSDAARRVKVSDATLYVWIKKGLLNPIYMENKKYLSQAELRFAREHFYQPGKATKKTVRK